MAHKILLSSLVFAGAALTFIGTVAANPASPPTQVTPATPTGQPQSPQTTTVVVTAAPTGDTPEVKGQRDLTRMICRTRPVLGSRLNKTRECHTAAEWEQMRRQASNGANGAVRSADRAIVGSGN